MPIGKSLRFEVFARDAFTCQYCGTRPPEVVLEVDHIHPVSKGGGNEIINLITSCYDCNRGKRSRIISEVAPRPDADLALLRVLQEAAEVRRFLAEKRKLDALNRKLCDALRETWAEKLTEFAQPSDRVLLPWIKKYGPREVEASILAAVPAYMSNRFGYNNDRAFNNLLPWVGAILRNRAQDKELETA